MKLHWVIFIAAWIVGASIIVAAFIVSRHGTNAAGKYTIAAGQGGDSNPVVWRLEIDTGQILLCSLQPHVNSAIVDPNLRKEVAKADPAKPNDVYQELIRKSRLQTETEMPLRIMCYG